MCYFTGLTGIRVLFNSSGSVLVMKHTNGGLSQTAGETFTNVKQKLIRQAEDASLSGLMARKAGRSFSGSDGKYDSLSGQDKREPAHEAVENNVAVLDGKSPSGTILCFIDSTMQHLYNIAQQK